MGNVIIDSGAHLPDIARLINFLGGGYCGGFV